MAPDAQRAYSDSPETPFPRVPRTPAQSLRLRLAIPGGRASPVAALYGAVPDSGSHAGKLTHSDARVSVNRAHRPTAPPPALIPPYPPSKGRDLELARYLMGKAELGGAV
jgi:hypothetical protein